LGPSAPPNLTESDADIEDNRDMTRPVSRAAARRFLAIRHLLAPPRSLPGDAGGVMTVFERLGSLQFDPLEVAGRNHDLALAARVDGYRRELTEDLLYGRRVLFEAYNKALSLLPAAELPYYRITWEEGARGRSGRLVAEQAGLAERILAEIEAGGPKCSGDFERQPAIDWWWGPTSAVRAVMDALNVAGRLNLARRDGNRRYYDLTERLFPAELLGVRVPERDQMRHKVLSRYRAHGLLGEGGSGELWHGTGPAALRAELRHELVDRGELAAVEVEGLKGRRYVLAGEMDLLVQAEREVGGDDGTAANGTAANGTAGAGDPVGGATPGCSFLAPLDPLLWDRQVLGPLYDFDYRWEVYTPAAKRRWGYYVLPVMFGDRLVGRIEPRIDRVARRVRILGLAWEPGFDPLAEPGFTAAFGDALAAYLRFGGAGSLVPPAGAAQRPLFREVARSVPVSRAATSARAATP
jgi:uncharacterized protein YcaQ